MRGVLALLICASCSAPAAPPTEPTPVAVHEPVPDAQPAQIETPTFERDDIGEERSVDKPVATRPASPSPDASCPEISCTVENNNNPCCPPRPRKKPPGTTLDRAMVSAGIAPVKAAVAACGSNVGVVKLGVTVTPSGQIKDIAIKQTPSPEIGACVARAMRSATFAKTDLGGTFSIPFHL